MQIILQIFAFITMLTLSTQVKAQTTLSDSIRMSVDFFEKDLKKAEGMLDIDERRLGTEPDSIQYMYHYYKAAVDELKGRSSKAQLQHLLTAKKIMESKLGIYHTVYFEIINAIGEKYEEFGMPDSAMVYWEEGFVKAIPLLQNKVPDENIIAIGANLAEYYNNIGHPEFSRYFIKWSGNKNAYNEIQDLSSKLNNTERNSESWYKLSYDLGVAYYKCYEYEKADSILSLLSKSLKDKNISGDILWQALSTLYNIAMENKDWEKALYYTDWRFCCANNIYKKDDEIFGWLYNQRAICLMNLSNFSEAECELGKAAPIILKAYSEDSAEYANIIHNNGRLCQFQEQYQMAYDYFQKASLLMIKHNGHVNHKTEQYIKEVKQNLSH